MNLSYINSVISYFIFPHKTVPDFRSLTDQEFWLSLCTFVRVTFFVSFQSDYGPVRKYCNIWRNFWDIGDNWNSLAGIIKYYGQNNSLFINYTGPGGFFDPDMVVYFYRIHSIKNTCTVNSFLPGNP